LVYSWRGSTVHPASAEPLGLFAQLTQAAISARSPTEYVDLCLIAVNF
jgi:hypothetical protein